MTEDLARSLVREWCEAGGRRRDLVLTPVGAAGRWHVELRHGGRPVYDEPCDSWGAALEAAAKWCRAHRKPAK